MGWIKGIGDVYLREGKSHVHIMTFSQEWYKTQATDLGYKERDISTAQ